MRVDSSTGHGLTILTGKEVDMHTMSESLIPRLTWRGFTWVMVGALIGFAVAQFIIPAIAFYATRTG